MITKNLRILVLPSFYPTSEFPLRGIFFKEQSEAIAKNVKSLDIIYPEQRSIKEITFSSFLKNRFQITDELVEGIRIIRMHRINFFRTQFDFNIGQRLWIKSCIKMCEFYFKTYGFPDLIHAHCAISAGEVARLVKNKYRIPFVLTEHSTAYTNKTLTPLLRGKIRNIFLAADHNVAVSKPFKTLLAKELNLSNETIKVIPNFIDTDFFSPSNVTIKKEDVFTFLIVCHLVSKKRVDRLIDAFTAIEKKHPKVELIIAGNGVLLNPLNEQVQNNKIAHKVRFFREANREEVKKLMQLSNCFVLPSDIETFGVVLIEALSCGIPVIATKSGGPEDIVNQENGLLIGKSVSELIDAMDYMISNISKYDPTVLRRGVISTFSVHAISKTYAELYESIYKKCISSIKR